MNTQENPYNTVDNFNVNDKVICIDDTSDFPNGSTIFQSPLEKGKIYNIISVNQYNIRGEVVELTGMVNGCGYGSFHFKLVNAPIV